MTTCSKPIRAFLSWAGALLLAGTLHSADAWLRYTSFPGSKVTIEGTSTIHDWTVEGKVIGGYFEVEPSFLTDLSLQSVKSLTTKELNPRVESVIFVTSLKSGKETMDQIMLEAMKADQHRFIRYKLTEMVLKGDVPASGSPAKFDTRGELAVAGVTQRIDLEVTLERVETDRLRISGVKALKMTDFKIAPPAPSLALGLIKTGDEVTVRFEWILRLKAPSD
ncbi:MAG: YceI family protein [Verrucomicrobia bacterium]|nr:YceI family protein [Verrucomicrobiota bacterium]